MSGIRAGFLASTAVLLTLSAASGAIAEPQNADPANNPGVTRLQDSQRPPAVAAPAADAAPVSAAPFLLPRPLNRQRPPRPRKPLRRRRRRPPKPSHRRHRPAPRASRQPLPLRRPPQPLRRRLRRRPISRSPTNCTISPAALSTASSAARKIAARSTPSIPPAITRRSGSPTASEREGHLRGRLSRPCRCRRPRSCRLSDPKFQTASAPAELADAESSCRGRHHLCPSRQRRPGALVARQRRHRIRHDAAGAGRCTRRMAGATTWRRRSTPTSRRRRAIWR